MGAILRRTILVEPFTGTTLGGTLDGVAGMFHDSPENLLRVRHP